MNFEVVLAKEAAKDFVRLVEPHKSLAREKIDLLSQYGLAVGGIKASKGSFKGLYRKRAGSFRIVFRIEGRKIFIVNIADRKDVYDE